MSGLQAFPPAPARSCVGVCWLLSFNGLRIHVDSGVHPLGIVIRLEGCPPSVRSPASKGQVPSRLRWGAPVMLDVGMKQVARSLWRTHEGHRRAFDMLFALRSPATAEAMGVSKSTATRGEQIARRLRGNALRA